MKKVDLGDILEKVGLSDDDKKEVTNQAADALKYCTNKEKARSNDNTMKNYLFNSSFTIEEINLPSAFPFNCPMIGPITLPMS